MKEWKKKKKKIIKKRLFGLRNYNFFFINKENYKITLEYKRYNYNYN